MVTAQSNGTQKRAFGHVKSRNRNGQNGVKAAQKPGQGSGQGGDQPALGDVMIQAAARNPNLLMELITTSTKPEEFIPQAFLTQGELNRDVRIMRGRNAWLQGTSKMEDLMWMGYAGSLAVDARARGHLTSLMGGGDGRIAGFFKGAFEKLGRNPDQPTSNQQSQLQGGSGK